MAKIFEVTDMYSYEVEYQLAAFINLVKEVLKEKKCLICKFWKIHKSALKANLLSPNCRCKNLRDIIVEHNH